MSDHNNAFQLRLIAVASALAAGWLAGRTDERSALRGERKLTPNPDELSVAARSASYAATAAGYPIIYIPLAWWLANQLERRGVRGAESVPQSALAAWLGYHVVKTVVHRERPPADQGSANDDRSYPSGHATAAAAIALSAATLWLRQKNARPSLVVPIAITPPLAVGASRVALAKHWPSDIAGGIATGLAIGAFVAANATENAESER